MKLMVEVVTPINKDIIIKRIFEEYENMDLLCLECDHWNFGEGNLLRGALYSEQSCPMAGRSRPAMGPSAAPARGGNSETIFDSARFWPQALAKTPP